MAQNEYLQAIEEAAMDAIHQKASILDFLFVKKIAFGNSYSISLKVEESVFTIKKIEWYRNVDLLKKSSPKITPTVIIEERQLSNQDIQRYQKCISLISLSIVLNRNIILDGDYYNLTFYGYSSQITICWQDTLPTNFQELSSFIDFIHSFWLA